MPLVASSFSSQALTTKFTIACVTASVATAQLGCILSHIYGSRSTSRAYKYDSERLEPFFSAKKGNIPIA
jgi:hypothetical protein